MSDNKIMPTVSDEALAINTQELALQDFGKRMFNPKLMALRAQMPFIPIMPFPNETIGLVLTADTPADINLPSGTKAVMFSGSSDYYVSRKGNAQYPGAGVDVNATGLRNPEFFLWYVEEISQFSVIAPARCLLTIQCYVQL